MFVRLQTALSVKENLLLVKMKEKNLLKIQPLPKVLSLQAITVTVTVTGYLLNTKVLTLVSRQLSQPVQSPSDMRYTKATRH